MISLAIVVPCFNEQEVLADTCEKLTGLLSSLSNDGVISKDSYIMFVDDGSSDDTWKFINRYASENENVQGLKLAANVGHQNALLAGLMTVKDEIDAAISIDADLQDDISVIKDMILKYEGGCDIVYGVRSSRKTDSFFKRFTAQGFYNLMKHMGAKSVYNHADFRLMSARSLDGLAQFKERNLFLRGIVPTIGFKTDCVYYERKERTAGKSKYPFGKMLAFALDGITSFSIKPMSYIMGTGVLMIILAIAFAIYALHSYVTGNVVSGWTSIVLSLWFIGGLVLFSIGVVGQYIGKIYLEVKERPRYIIESRIGNGE
ncbi:MAG: glycosyltransferase family 2 protein [Lachnospiraceae bacterium]|nr:glycosyltransferase family 2 protein [Lachnospiraceae bacterium]MBR5767017.1 glycosyltransferase family 2 protein [Lachnospiraceae bacterium]